MRPGRKRELAAQLCGEWDVSIRRACRVLEFETLTYHYKARRRDQAGIEARIKDICATWVRYGYRRVHALLRREGLGDQPEANAQDLQRVGHAAEEQHAQEAGEGEASRGRQEAVGPNEVWEMDFVHDQLATAPSCAC